MDAAATTPPYDQIRSQIETMAISGVLEPGTRLPSIRQLAADLGLAPATVARAFAELERAGVVESHRGRGTTLVGPGHPAPRAKVRAELQAAAEAFVQRAQQLGVTRSAAIDAVGRTAQRLAESD